MSVTKLAMSFGSKLELFTVIAVLYGLAILRPVIQCYMLLRLSGESGSSAGGLSSIDRKLAIHLSNHSAVKVSLLVQEGACNTEEIREADGYGITIVEAKERAAYDRLDWLSIPPQE